MSNDLRASELVERMSYREYGMDDAITIKTLDQHGDTMLITSEDGTETTLDIDTVVERLYPLPAFQMDVTGQCYGGAFWSEADYRVCMAVEDSTETPVVFWVEDSAGTRLTQHWFSPEEIEGITWMSNTNHSLDGYEDDWSLPVGMDRILIWDLPTDDDNNVRLDDAQITEVAAWLRFAIGEETYTGGPEWEF